MSGINDILATFKDEKEIVYDGARYVEKSKEGISLKGVLQRGRLKRIREEKPYSKTPGFNPSKLTYPYCRRLSIGHLAGKVEVFSEKFTPSTQTVMDLGNQLHDLIQNYFWDIGLLRGSFKCISCNRIYHDLTAPRWCPTGKDGHGRNQMKYKEIIYKNDEYLIRGRADGVIVIDDEEHLMDIKSIQNRTIKTVEKQYTFEDLEHYGPKEDHIVQLQFYMWMSGIHRGHLLYVARNNGQIKTFDIPYQPELLDPYLQEIKHLMEQAEKLKNGEHVVLPEPCGRKDCVCDQVLGNIPPVEGGEK